MSRRPLAVVALLAVVAGSATGAQAAFFKCDVGGRVVYQDSPCPPGGGGQVDLKPLTLMDGSNPSQAGKSEGPYDSTLWYSDAAGHATALRESERTGAPLLVFFYTDWCPYCKQFSANVLPDAAVAQRLRRFVKVRINTERGTREGELFRSAGGRGIPFVTVQPAGGRAAQINTTRTGKDFAVVLDGQLAQRK